MRGRKNGFTMVELVVVMAIIGVLATIAGQSFLVGMARAKRAEAKAGISGVVAAERAYYAAEREYSGSFDQLAFGIDGATRISSTEIDGKVYVAQLSGGGGWYHAQFTGDLDTDSWPDTMVAQEGQATATSFGGWQLYDDITNSYNPLPVPSGTPTPASTGTPAATPTPAATATPVATGTPAGGGGGGGNNGNEGNGNNGNGNNGNSGNNGNNGNEGNGNGNGH